MEVVEVTHFDNEGKCVYVGLVIHALYTISYVSRAIISSENNKCVHASPLELWDLLYHTQRAQRSNWFAHCLP